jgi:uncharacterized membrane protein YgcG
MRHLAKFILVWALAAIALLPIGRAQDAPKPFSKEELEQMVAPIALYPDSLVAQILMASTYPLEIVSAARWSKSNPKVTGKALEDAMQKQPWDAAVKSLTAVPKVLEQMNEKLDWTQKLGDAFLGQQKEVMDAVQRLRTKALAAGNLKSTPEQTVKTDTQAGKTIYIIESPKTEVIYVPTYNPAVVYGPWPYAAYPPYYMYPPAYVYPPGVAFATGVVVGAAIWGNANWNNGNVNVNVNQYNSYNKTNIQNTNFQHNAEHRKGVQYRDQGSQQKYGKDQRKGADSREQFRGRAEAGQRDIAKGGADGFKGGDRGGTGGAGDRGGPGDRGGAGDRGGGMQRASGGGGAGAFDGAGRGGDARAQSSRGASSRASAGSHGGGRGGGGGRGRR